MAMSSILSILKKPQYTVFVLANALKSIKKLDKFLDQHALLLVALGLVVILRVPNFYEPYWYGDEGIYLTIGQALNKGAQLYTDIVDHKTPIIYWLAQVGTQLNFRILNFFWMSATTVLFYLFALRLSQRRLAAGIATIIFALFTTLPWFEGNIPNGELFVIGLVMLGAVLVSYSSYFAKLVKPKTALKLDKKEVWLLLGAGMAFGLGVLTKVPALFDFAAFGTIGFFILANTFTFAPKQMKKWRPLLLRVIRQWGLLIAGILIPIVVSALYFVAKGSGADYLQYGLLYNFHYAGNWGLPFDNRLLIFAFTLQGKFAIATALILLAAFFKKLFKPGIQFLLAWFILALFASLLSNRPYPHYFLQALPPLSLLMGIFFNDLFDVIRKKKQFNFSMAGNWLATLGGVGLFGTVMLLLQVGVYPVKAYYQNWWELRTGQISVQEYNRRFNYLMDDNYTAAKIIRASGENKIFVWGTNPMLYAQSGASPVGKFTVAFHIKDLEVYDQTMEAVVEEAPRYIVVMKSEGYNFPDFYTYLHAHYRPAATFDNYILWRRIANDENS